MTYEEKRELRLQISQLLADAGLNQKAIKDMVETEIKNKVDRAVEHKVDRVVEQCMNSLNSECRSGNYIKERIEAYIGSYGIRMDMAKAIKEELSSRIIQVVLKDCKSNEVEKISS